MNKGCISAEEYEAVFILCDIAIFLRDLLKGDTEKELQYLEHLVHEICRVRAEVDGTKIV